MGPVINGLECRRKAIKCLAELMTKKEFVIIIHYSCESFYDRPSGTSPRITSIAARNFASGQTTSFSIHQVAERKHNLNNIDEYYDKLEKEMLSDFFMYVKLHENYTWLHWNMRDINYGFKAIEHRYRVLGGSPVVIRETFLVDLSRLFIAIYGERYIGNPRLTKLVELNGIGMKDYLTGADEAQAFIDKEYVKLHFSTLRKVDILSIIAEKAYQGRLKTLSTIKETWPGNLQVVAELVIERPIVSLVLFFISVIGLLLGIAQVVIAVVK